MKDLAGHFGMSPLRGVQQITVPLAKGVVNLGHDGRQTVVGAVAIPKTDGLEGVTQNTWKSLQPNLTLCVMNTFFFQNFIQSSQCATLFWRAAITMVNNMKRQATCAVDGQITGGRRIAIRLLLKAAHWQHQKIGAIVKGVHGRTTAHMPNLAKANERVRLIHRCKSNKSCRATLKPDFRPSS